MNNADRSDLRALLTATEVTQGICALPAVATLEWCDRAAACLKRIGGDSHVVLVIGSLGENGLVSSIEAVGVASSSNGGPRLSETGGSTVSAAVGAETLRSRADRLASIGWTPGDRAGQPAFFTASSTGAEWRQGPLGRLWSGLSANEVLIGVLPLGGTGADAGRSLIVMIAPAGQSAAAEDLRIMEATLPLMAQRVLRALGPTRSSSRSWLTPREQQVLEHLSLGRSVKQIAEAIGRSPHTVHDHVKALHRKLRANSRGELIAKALGHIDAYQFEPAAAPRSEPQVMTTYSGANGATRQVG